MKTYMGIDQAGQTFHDLGPHPRKALMLLLGKKSASKMYVDGKDGKIYHTGYVIGRNWVTLYEVVPFRRKS